LAVEELNIAIASSRQVNQLCKENCQECRWMSYSLYQIDLPENSEAVVFVNGFLARDRAGFFWMWKHLFWIRSATSQAKGCVQVKAGICGAKEVIMVSYWRSEKDLQQFFRGEPHRQMMQFVRKHPDSLCLYNETYRPGYSGKYSHEPQGMATLYRRLSGE
jgi:heme-degrading monooxygenase HmoA